MPGNRRSIRLKNYDYSKKGVYFVTVCIADHVCRGASRGALNHNTFGYIKNKKMILNPMGKIVYNSWKWLEKQYKYVNLDEFIIMPNHMHGIVILGNDNNYNVQGASRGAPTGCKPLGQLIGAFKTVSTKQINAIRNTDGARFWQRNFYEHIIRNEDDMNKIREYIVYNPTEWEKDEYYKAE